MGSIAGKAEKRALIARTGTTCTETTHPGDANMRITFALIVATLVALPGLAAAFSTAPAPQPRSVPDLFPAKLELVDREGLTPQEWVRAMMERNSPVDLTYATFTPLEVPAGRAIVGRVVGGTFTLEVVPEAVATPRTTIQAPLGVEPGRDCLLDTVGWGAQGFLSGNILYPAVPNVDSAGLCESGSGLAGPVNHLTFQITGDAGGVLHVQDRAGTGFYQIGCYPYSDGTAAVMAGASGGVGSQFVGTHQVADSLCYASQLGTQPSAWSDHIGGVAAWNQVWGAVYGSTLTTGVPVGDIP